MSEGEGQVAGRLDVLVEASTRGFKAQLKRKVDEAAKGLNAKIGVELDTKGLREKLQAAADEAASGVKVKIGVDLDAGTLKAKAEAAAKAAETSVKVTADGDLAGDVARKTDEAQADADMKPVKVGLRARAARFLADVMIARDAAQAEADADPVKVKVKADTSGFSLSGHTLMRVGMYSSIASMIEPLLGGIGQVVGGLTAMAGASAPAVGTLEALPAVIGSGIQGMLAMKVAASGEGQAIQLLSRQQMALANGTKLSTLQQQQLKRSMKELSPAARAFAKDVVGLRSKWVGLRKDVQQPLFKTLDQHLKPVVNTDLPMLDKGLTGTSKALSGVIGKTLRWMTTPLFTRQFSGAMQQNNATLTAGGDALLNIGKGLMWFYRASAPFQTRMDGVIESTGRWFRMWAQYNAQNGDTAAFLKTAGDRLSLLWNITKQFGGGLGGIFHAAMPTGVDLLHNFDQFLTDWHQWVDSTQGQNYLSGWFHDTAGGFKEIARLVDDTFKGIAHWAADPRIQGMIRDIRTKLGPALSQLLQALSHTMGGNVIGVITQLARALNNAEPALQVLSDMTSGLVGLASAMNTVMEKGGPFTQDFMKIAGAMLVLRSGKKLLGKVGLGRLAAGRAAATEGAAAGGGGLLEALGVGALFGGGGGGKAAETAMSRTRLLRRFKAMRRLRAMGGIAGDAKYSSVLGDAVEAGVKSPLLKKAGWIGLALTAYSLYGDVKKGMYAFPNAGKKYRGALGAHGQATPNAAAAILHQFHLGNNLSQYADLFGFNNKKLAQSIARGGSHSAYYQQLMARLQKEKGHGFMGYLSGLDSTLTLGHFGYNANQASYTLSNLKDIAAAVDKVRAKIKAKIAAEKADAKAAREAAKQQAEWDKKLKGLPPFVKTQIEQPGMLKSLGQVALLAQAYHLTPKQIMTVLRTSGVLKSMADIKQAQKVFNLTPKQVAVLVATHGVAKSMADVRKLQKQYKLTPRQVVTLIKTSGVQPTLRDVVHLQRQYHLTPKQVATLLKATGVPLSIGLIQRLQHQYKITPKSVETYIKAIDRATGVISRIQYGLGQIHSKAVTVSVTESRNFKMNHLPGSGVMKSGGGAVFGPGTDTSDSIPAWLSNNEYVIRAKSVKKYGLAMLNAINAGRFANGGLVGRYAGGGHVHHHGHLSTWLSGAFLQGIQQGAHRIAQEQAALTRRVGRQISRHFARQFHRLERQAKKRSAIADRLTHATAKLAHLNSARSKMVHDFTNGATQYGSVTGIASAWGGYLSPTSLVGELKRRYSNTLAFAHHMNRLRHRGLSARAYEQLAAAGVQTGGPLAAQLAHASKAQIQHINRLQHRIQQAAKTLGQHSARHYYAAGIHTAQGLVRGLRHKQRALDRAARHMANTLVKAVKHELKINSPSRVMAEVGGFTVDGIGVGMDARSARLMQKARALTAQLTAELSPADTYGSSHLGTLWASGRHATAGLGDGAASLAPLVGQLIIQGKSDEEIQNALEEAMFALREIRQGGVHADRVA